MGMRRGTGLYALFGGKRTRPDYLPLLRRGTLERRGSPREMYAVATNARPAAACDGGGGGEKRLHERGYLESSMTIPPPSSIPPSSTCSHPKCTQNPAVPMPLTLSLSSCTWPAPYPLIRNRWLGSVTLWPIRDPTPGHRRPERTVVWPNGCALSSGDQHAEALLARYDIGPGERFAGWRACNRRREDGASHRGNAESERDWRPVGYVVLGAWRRYGVELGEQYSSCMSILIHRRASSADIHRTRRSPRASRPRPLYWAHWAAGCPECGHSDCRHALAGGTSCAHIEAHE
ncbi:hypothetical protein FB451DRAFT_402733 [Mycena latifolia]|nr:hypothetical protein FB451DRAFT_402733 [Mycena latifolia]